MVDIQIKKIIPFQDLRSSFEVTFSIEMDNRYTPVNIVAYILSNDKKYLSKSEELNSKDYNLQSSQLTFFAGSFIRTNQQFAHIPERYERTLRFFVDKRELDYIDDLRYKNQNNEIILNFVIKIIWLEHNLYINNNLIGTNNSEALGKREFFKINEYKENLIYKISSTEWINDFKPKLGYDDSLLLEIKIPAITDSFSKFDYQEINLKRFYERLKEAKSSINNMRNYINKGEWTQVAEELRSIQLFTSDITADIKKLLKATNNFPDEKINEFTQGLDKIYSFSSHYHHRVRRSGDINSISNVSKEDAYFIYMLVTSITQLLSNKLELLRRNAKE